MAYSSEFAPVGHVGERGTQVRRQPRRVGDVLATCSAIAGVDRDADTGTALFQ
jgi:hypothetical protein